MFGEIKARTQETDLSVPSYATPRRTATALLVLRPHRRGLGVRDLLPRPGPRTGARRPTPEGEIAGEQVLLDANVEAEGHEFFSLGAFSVSPDGRLLAYSIDITGDERFTLRVKDLTTGELLRRPDPRHRVRGGLGRQRPPLLHPSRRRPGGRTSCSGTGWAPTRPPTSRC